MNNPVHLVYMSARSLNYWNGYVVAINPKL